MSILNLIQPLFPFYVGLLLGVPIGACMTALMVGCNRDRRARPRHNIQPEGDSHELH